MRAAAIVFTTVLAMVVGLIIWSSINAHKDPPIQSKANILWSELKLTPAATGDNAHEYAAQTDEENENNNAEFH